MSTLLINYADQGYSEAQKLNTRTGLLVGGLDRAIQFGRREPFLSVPQALGSFFVCQKKSSFTLAFFEEWLGYAQDPRILPGQPNECGLPNYPDYFEHRFDQSILSLLGGKHGIATVPASRNGETASARPRSLRSLPTHAGKLDKSQRPSASVRRFM